MTLRLTIQALCYNGTDSEAAVSAASILKVQPSPLSPEEASSRKFSGSRLWKEKGEPRVIGVVETRKDVEAFSE